MEGKTNIIFRIENQKKNEWILKSKEKNISLTELIISAVENKIDNSERREVLSFIEKQSNIFSKIENNINQVARIVNSQKVISDDLLNIFNQTLRTVVKLKAQQNSTLNNIYKELSK